VNKAQLRIEAFRGLAAALVVMTHYAPMVFVGVGLWILGATGVSLFFVLSGFVFAPYFERGSMDYIAHLIRRVFRLFPLYLCALLVYVALHEPTNRWQYFWPHVFMLHTLGVPEVTTFYNGAFWSLPPEIEFYLILPLLAVFVQRRSLALLFVMALAMHVVLNGAHALDFSNAGWRAAVVDHLPGCLVLFLLGVAAARWARSLGQSLVRRTAVGALGVGMIAALAAYVHFVYLPQIPGHMPITRFVILFLFGVSYALCVASACATRQNSVSSVSDSAAVPCASSLNGVPQPWWSPVARWSGRLSYGVYLFHNAAPPIASQMIDNLSGRSLLVASLSTTLVLALIGHLVVEQPMRELGRRWASKRGRYVDSRGIGTVLKSALNIRSMDTVKGWAEKLTQNIKAWHHGGR
jgi:peptidoglycan/LPS O-acetylase OafA/YrhL